MANKTESRYPLDRFDTVSPGGPRIGAHRKAGTQRPRYTGLLLAVGATIVLILGGILAVSLMGSAASPAASPDGAAAPAEVVPTVDSSLTLSVLNGTATKGLASFAATILAGQGWTQKITVGNAAVTTTTQTVVYYADPEQEGAARGVVQDLGVGTVTLGAPSVPLGSATSSPKSTAKATPKATAPSEASLTVVLGADFTAR